MQEMLGYTATTSGMVFAPAGLCTMIVVPFVGYMLTLGYDPRKMVFFGLVVLASSFWWMSSLNLEIAERNIILPRIVQVLGAGIVTVPVSTIIFRFLPKTESSQAAGLYALMRNEGGSIGIALVSTMLQRKAQLHQQILGENITASSSLVQRYIGRAMASPGNVADHRYLALANLYNAMQRQAMLLAWPAAIAVAGTARKKPAEHAMLGVEHRQMMVGDYLDPLRTRSSRQVRHLRGVQIVGRRDTGQAHAKKQVGRHRTGDVQAEIADQRRMLSFLQRV